MSCFRHGVFSFSSSCLANTLGGSAQGPTHVFTSKFLAKEEEASSSAWLRRACLMWEVKRSVTFLFFFWHWLGLVTCSTAGTCLLDPLILWKQPQIYNKLLDCGWDTEELRVSWLLFMAGIKDMRNDLLGRQSSSADVFTLGQQEFIYWRRNNSYFCLLTTLRTFHQNSSTEDILKKRWWGKLML